MWCTANRYMYVLAGVSAYSVVELELAQGLTDIVVLWSVLRAQGYVPYMRIVVNPTCIAQCLSRYSPVRMCMKFQLLKLISSSHCIKRYTVVQWVLRDDIWSCGLWLSTTCHTLLWCTWCTYVGPSAQYTYMCMCVAMSLAIWLINPPCMCDRHTIHYVWNVVSKHSLHNTHRHVTHYSAEILWRDSPPSSTCLVYGTNLHLHVHTSLWMQLVHMLYTSTTLCLQEFVVPAAEAEVFP